MDGMPDDGCGGLAIGDEKGDEAEKISLLPPAVAPGKEDGMGEKLLEFWDRGEGIAKVLALGLNACCGL
jgi:streptomycin 6-kinase